MPLKSILSCFLFVLSIFGCNQNEQTITDRDFSFISGWEQFENAYSPGNGLIVEEVEDGDRLIIKEDKSFLWQSVELRSGSWQELSADEILMTFDDGSIISYRVEILSDIMKFTPTNPICIEGCYTRWKRNRVLWQLD